MAFYLAMCINTESKEDAAARLKRYSSGNNHKHEKVVIREHEDGRVTINILQSRPVQPGQKEFHLKDGE